MTEYGWKYTWAAKFNQSSNLLMVAGFMNDVDGKIAMFMVIFRDYSQKKVVVTNCNL